MLDAWGLAAAERATAQDGPALRHLHSVQETHLSNDRDIESLIGADMQLHRCIAEILQNPIVSAASNAMLRWLREYHVTALHWSGNDDVTLGEHARILDRIQSNDPSGAAAEKTRHLDRTQVQNAPRQDT